MDKLTPTLNDVQIKQNIDALQKQGVSNDKIQSYVNNYAKGGDGNYVLKTAGGDTPAKPAGSVLGTTLGVAKAVGNAVTQNEQNSGQDIAGAIGGNAFSGTFNAANQKISDADLAYLKNVNKNRQAAMAKGDTATVSRYDDVLKNFQSTKGVNIADVFPSINKSNAEVLGDFGGMALDVASAGSYGEAAKGAETGALLTKEGSMAGRIATSLGVPVVEQAGKQTVEQATKTALMQTLKTIGKEAAVHSGIGAAQGYGYDVANNFQEGKTGAGAFTPGWGTAVGAAIPAGMGAIKAGSAIAADQAPRIINSLVKPLLKDFSYGKNPGRAVAEMGITGNSLDDLASNISKARQQVGQNLSEIYSNPELEGITVNAQPSIDKIDSAMADAAKGGKNNQSIVTRLQNAKEALMYEHTVGADGTIVPKIDPKTGMPIARDFSKLTPQEAFDLKKDIGDMTKFTGNASDDKTVNGTLKSVYGGIKDSLNAAVTPISPELPKLNERYADLTSAEVATKYRDIIDQRRNLISMPIKVGGVAGLITAIGTGGAAIPALLAGASVAMIDKALESTAVKTRVASWLGSESPNVVSRFFAQYPGIGASIARALPKFAAQAGQGSKSNFGTQSP